MKSRHFLYYATHLIVLVLLLAACAASLKFATTPFGWIDIAGFIFFIQLCILFKPPVLSNAALVLAFVFLPLAIAEFYLTWEGAKNIQTTYTPEDSMYREIDTLGYGPRPSNNIHAVRVWGKTPVYDAHYGINASAMRITPASNPDDSAPCLLFFGGSFTFGEGVDDTQTMPNQVAELTNHTYRVLNFGFPGYGAHQMLAALDFGIAKKAASGCKQVTAIYTGIAQHVGRAAGKAFWDIHGPAYHLDESGKIHFAGHFDEVGIPYFTRARLYLYKSNVYQLLFGWHLTGKFDKEQIKTYVAIVAAARDKAKQQFGNNTTFESVMWGNEFFHEDKHTFEKLISAMRLKNLSPLIIDRNALPTDSDFSAYKLSPHDSHPNALAYARAAQYLVNKLQLHKRK